MCFPSHNIFTLQEILKLSNEKVKGEGRNIIRKNSTLLEFFKYRKNGLNIAKMSYFSDLQSLEEDYQ